MLERCLNKKVEVAIAFREFGNYAPRTLKVKGTITAYDEKFIILDDETIIGINYIQVINIL